MAQETDIIRIAIVGPESTGKTTLAGQLAEFFKTTFVPEFAREYLEARNGRYVEAELREIARGQLELERSHRQQCGDLLICDTNIFSIKIWSDFKYKRCDEWINCHARDIHYDLYLLTDIDVPWNHDPLRENPDPADRSTLYEMHLKALKDLGHNFTLISGNFNDRKAEAIKVVEQLIKNKA